MSKTLDKNNREAAGSPAAAGGDRPHGGVHITDSEGRLSPIGTVLLIIAYAYIAFALNFTLELLNLRPPLEVIGDIFGSPLIFAYNALIILTTLTVGLLFRKRTFFTVLIALVWLTAGIINCVVMQSRITPLSAIDFQIITTALGIITVYLKPAAIALIVAAAAVTVFLLVLLYRKTKKHRPIYIRTVLTVLASVILLILSTEFLLNVKELSKRFPINRESYAKYGFVYCFAGSFFNTGIEEPTVYGKPTVDYIFDKIGAGTTNEPADKPNIVFLQLESFFDVNHIKGYEYSENPIPVFTELKEKYPSGYLTVPTLGGGTANVEFETLTGMSLKYFGPGEYPYKTVLADSTCESICYNLAELGYTSHAIHDHTGTFYDRHLVYSKLGFNTFTPIEYMSGVEYNKLNWACDKILTRYIQKALKSTETQDFVFAVSVQGHGKYPEEEISEPDITFSGAGSEKDEISFEYYISQLKEMDGFIGELITALSELGEPTVLVVYGDHLPALDISGEELENGSLYQTEYVVWNNIGLEKEDADIETNRLSSYVLGKLGMNNGIITKLHQAPMGEELRGDLLEILEYDMLYGDMECYGGSSPYAATELVYGLDPIEITGVRYNNDGYVMILGKNFTQSSRVYINGFHVQSIIIDGGALLTNKRSLQSGDRITVRQATLENVTLGETEQFVYSGLVAD